jgi:hypothetical protein
MGVKQFLFGAATITVGVIVGMAVVDLVNKHLMGAPKKA